MSRSQAYYGARRFAKQVTYYNRGPKKTTYRTKKPKRVMPLWFRVMGLLCWVVFWIAACNGGKL